MKDVSVRKGEAYWLTAGAGALLLGGPLWRYLYVNHYPFAKAEAILLPLGAALLGATLAVVGQRLGRWPKVLVFGGLLFIFVDLQADPEKWTYMAVTLVACMIIAAIFWQRLATLTCLTVGTFYLASLPRSGVSASAAVEESGAIAATAANLPPLVHIILDEQWGIGGLLAEGDTATAAFLNAFYLERGFEVFPAAYSRYDRTRESIPQLIGLGEKPRLDSAVHTSPPQYILSTLPYFELLRSRGYRIHVYQTSYLDFCGAPNAEVVFCETQEGNSIANVGYLPGNWVARAELASRFFLNVSSHIYRRLHRDPVFWRRANAGGGLRTLQRVRDAIAADSSGGNAYFIHALIPHRPTTLDGRCAARADEPPSPTPGRGLNDAAWRWTIERMGWQIQCAHRAIADLVAVIDSTSGATGAIMIIHGDHGARIFQQEPKASTVTALDRRELNGFYSTLLAIRRPSVPARTYAEAVPVQDFLWHLARSGFAGPPRTDWQHFVYGRVADSIRSHGRRVLGEDEMLWVGVSQRAGASPGRPRH